MIILTILLTVLVQVLTLDNILMYSYVHNICLYCSLPCCRNINFCFICFILRRPWVQSQIKNWATFTTDFHCFLQNLCANAGILSQIMQWTLTSTLVLMIHFLYSHQSTLYNMRYWKHYYRNDKQILEKEQVYLDLCCLFEFRCTNHCVHFLINNFSIIM